jgi:hypothetical protein
MQHTTRGYVIRGCRQRFGWMDLCKHLDKQKVRESKEFSDTVGRHKDRSINICTVSVPREHYHIC